VHFTKYRKLGAYTIIINITNLSTSTYAETIPATVPWKQDSSSKMSLGRPADESYLTTKTDSHCSSFNTEKYFDITVYFGESKSPYRLDRVPLQIFSYTPSIACFPYFRNVGIGEPWNKSFAPL
jgi:hypothetical protein